MLQVTSSSTAEKLITVDSIDEIEGGKVIIEASSNEYGAGSLISNA